MSRPIPSTTTTRSIREHFGLSQDELGRFLGVTAGQVAHVEAGRRSWSAKASPWETWLQLLLPIGEGGLGPAGPPEPQPAAGPAEPADLLALDARRDYCQHQASVLRYELRQLDKRVAAYRRRQWGVGILRAALLPAPGAPPLVAAHAVFPARDWAKDEKWLAWLEAGTALMTVPSPVARQMLALRIRLLEEEAAALAAMQAELAPPPAG